MKESLNTNQEISEFDIINKQIDNLEDNVSLKTTLFVTTIGAAYLMSKDIEQEMGRMMNFNQKIKTSILQIQKHAEKIISIGRSKEDLDIELTQSYENFKSLKGILYKNFNITHIEYELANIEKLSVLEQAKNIIVNDKKFQGDINGQLVEAGITDKTDIILLIATILLCKTQDVLGITSLGYTSFIRTYIPEIRINEKTKFKTKEDRVSYIDSLINNLNLKIKENVQNSKSEDSETRIPESSI